MVRDSIKSKYDLHLHRQRVGALNSRVSMNKSSHVIAKIKPKIRIIHIFAPEIIQTDVNNFRSLVQSLTGKHAADDAKTGQMKTEPKTPVIANQYSTGDHHDQVNRLIGFSDLLENGGVKEEWPSGVCSNSNTYFDLEGLIDHGDDFHTFPMKSSHTDGIMFNNISNQTKGYLP